LNKLANDRDASVIEIAGIIMSIVPLKSENRFQILSETDVHFWRILRPPMVHDSLDF
jgi:allophanate hydrolase subunit 1